MKIKTPSDLKYAVECAGYAPYFFTRDTMKYFGDTMKNYGIVNHEHYITLYRKKPVKHGLSNPTYFCNKTFKRILNLESFLNDLTSEKVTPIT